MNDRQSRGSGRLIVGLVLLTLGFLWTLDNLGILDADHVLRWWPLILVAIGTVRMVGGGPNRFFSGLLLLSAGMLLTLRELHVIRFRFWDLWPVFIMLVGASVVVRSLRRDAPVSDDEKDPVGLNIFAFMGAVIRKVGSKAFTGGEITAVMAGAEIDLRGAQMADGRAVIDVFTWWGGIDLTVPEDWEVVSEATPIMGAFEDKRTGGRTGSGPKLIVRGLIVMGGVEVKN